MNGSSIVQGRGRQANQSLQQTKPTVTPPACAGAAPAVFAAEAGVRCTKYEAVLANRLALPVWLALFVASPALSIEPRLELNVNYDTDGVAVVATAENRSSCTLFAVGPWRFQITYTPNEESAKRIAQLDSIAKTEQYSRWHGVRTPRFIPRRFGTERMGVPPGGVFCDTLSVQFWQGYYEQWPGWLEVNCFLEYCVDGGEPSTTGEAATAEAALVVRIPVPPGGT